MSTPPEELPAPPSKTPAKPAPPKPPRRAPKRDQGDAKADAKADNGPGTVASATSAPAPPRRGNKSTSSATAAISATAAAGAKAPAPPKPVRSAPPIPPQPTVAAAEADADAVLVDERKAPTSRRLGAPSRSQQLPVVETPTVATSARTSAVHSERHYRQTVVKVDLWSVTKLSLCFYVSAMFVTVVAVVALWVIADAAGIIHSVEKFLGDLLSAKNFHFLSATVLRGAILVGLVVVALQVVITVIGASFYNIFAELFGGVEITVKEEGGAE